MTELSDLLAHHESGHFRFRTGWVTMRPDPKDVLLIWVLTGEMDVTVGTNAYRARPGDLTTLRPGVSHRYAPTTTTGWEWLWLHVGGGGADSLAARLSARGPLLHLGADPRVRSRFTEVLEVAATGDLRKAGTRLHLDSCAYSLLGLLVARAEATGGTSGSDALTHMVSWVADHLDQPITVAALARASGWSTPQLSRLTRRHLGASPMGYVTRVRMREAARLLVDTELSVTEVARRVGFVDPLHFSRRFRQVTGLSPTLARQRNPI